MHKIFKLFPINIEDKFWKNNKCHAKVILTMAENEFEARKLSSKRHGNCDDVWFNKTLIGCEEINMENL